MNHTIASAEVLTLEETAVFLRVSSEAVMRLVAHQALPGRQIDGQWRFLRAGIADWLREKSGKAILVSQAGALVDDVMPTEVAGNRHGANSLPTNP